MLEHGGRVVLGTIDGCRFDDGGDEGGVGRAEVGEKAELDE